MTTQKAAAHHDPDDNDLDVVALWLKWDPIRVFAGVLAGALAGLFAAGVGGVFSIVAKKGALYPLQVLAAVPLGSSATEMGAGGSVLITGLAMLLLLSVFWGVVFAQFAPTNTLSSLLGVGLSWGAFTWIFIWNLFLPSFKSVLWLQIPQGIVFPICMVYGIALTSVAFFDRALRGK